jgi:hypothetical protein
MAGLYYMTRCRHERHSWIIGGHSEWCYVCGAYRGLKVIKEGMVAPRTNWVRPTGKPENNPYDTLKQIKS